MRQESSTGETSNGRTVADGFTELPHGLRLYRNLVVLLTAACLVALAVYHWLGIPLYKAELWSIRSDAFGDLWHYIPLFSRIHTAGFFQQADRFAYPAPCALAYQLLYAFGSGRLVFFFGLYAVTLLFSATLFARGLLRAGLTKAQAIGLVALLICTSDPWWILLDRANIELFVYIFLASGTWAYLRRQPVLAAVLWSLAGAMKLYPLVLLALFLHRRTLRPLLTGLLTFAATLIGSLWYVGPTVRVAAVGSLDGMAGFLSSYAATARRIELNHDHSLLGALKEIFSLHMMHIGTHLKWLSQGYEAAVFIVFPILYFVWIRKLPALNQLCLDLIAIVLLPPVSYDYTLVHLYLVIGIVCVSYLQSLVGRRNVLPHASSFFVAFAMLCSSVAWLRVRGLQFNGLFKTVSLVTIAVLLLRQPLTLDGIYEGSEGPEEAALAPEAWGTP